VLGGIGGAAVGRGERGVRPDSVASALETDKPETIGDPAARRFRAFAERSTNDLRALAAVMRRPHAPGEPGRVRRIDKPVLIVVGANDDLARGAAHLAELIPGSKLVVVPDRDHLTVVGDPRYKDAVLSFLTKGK
jgi:pimeloyl-ACP methyl ester carboxylesterase